MRFASDFDANTPSSRGFEANSRRASRRARETNVPRGEERDARKRLARVRAE